MGGQGRVAELQKGWEESKDGETAKGRPPKVERMRVGWRRDRKDEVWRENQR